ncbi:MAG TPA: type II toxin-antitoxin system HicA family toxin [bacterium]|nr:type II toxin-antitoxin system HicA family toxin [bacterium]HPR89267.1 type II toxin-antitoxin system HicA family toxin [bacterium]
MSRSDLVKKLRNFGFSGPFQGGRHEFMIRGTTRLTLPNVHHGEISSDLLSRILRQAGIAREDWK